MAGPGGGGGNGGRERTTEPAEIDLAIGGGQVRKIAVRLWKEGRTDLIRAAGNKMRGHGRERAEIPEDIVAAVFAALLAGELRFDGPEERLPAFLRVVCARWASRASARARRTVDFGESGVFSFSSKDDPFGRAEALEVAERLRTAWGRFPPRMGEVARLRWIEGASIGEIGHRLDISIHTVRTHLRRARKQLRDSLGSVYPGAVVGKRHGLGNRSEMRE